ncbi:hypothetical protein PIB30_060248 [Stylosanthes scabra]|uniref:Uncharacterized protein n=1 Tax=Stylosanthes scabra TaxID=79078 RepID=A0ABU6ZJ71_9FABA|nr:hypothetical protein [Stylosanthes scabra]
MEVAYPNRRAAEWDPYHLITAVQYSGTDAKPKTVYLISFVDTSPMWRLCNPRFPLGGAFTFGVFSVEAPFPLAPPMWNEIAALAPSEQETRPVLAPPSQHGKKNDSGANVANGGS